jgi:catechol 2,3-dioxygenase-like lactoylglutathione lyase family enzyme
MPEHPPTAGRVFSHVTVGTSSIDRAMDFYDAVLAPLGLKRKRTHKIAIGYGPEGFAGINEPFWVLRPYDRNPASAGNGVTVAFTAPTQQAVDAFHAAALAHGGADAGAPGLRTHYHPNYYGAYVRDPDGNKICAVCHQPVKTE